MTYPYLHHTEKGELYTENFSIAELRCRCNTCNRRVAHKIKPEALQKHQELRKALGRRYTPSSAFRCHLHPYEIAKDKPGEHNRTAMDIPVKGGLQRAKVVQEALKLGATGIGVARDYVHVDFRPGPLVMWVY